MKKTTKETTKETKKDSKKTHANLHIIVVVILALFAAGSFYSYMQVKDRLDALSTTEGQQALQEKETSKVVNRVRKHMVLPEELPTMATVTDIDTLREEQAFFKDAENGDQLLIYTGDQRAIIYRPSTDIIVNVGPISIPEQQQAVASPATSSESDTDQTDN